VRQGVGEGNRGLQPGWSLFRRSWLLQRERLAHLRSDGPGPVGTAMARMSRKRPDRCRDSESESGIGNGSRERESGTGVGNDFRGGASRAAVPPSVPARGAARVNAEPSPAVSVHIRAHCRSDRAAAPDRRRAGCSPRPFPRPPLPRHPRPARWRNEASHRVDAANSPRD